MANNTGAQEARAVAEAAREKDWTLPSFGKGLFLGDIRLDLIYPQPRLPDDAIAKGERFLATLRDFLQENVDPQVIERDSRIPDEVIDGLITWKAAGIPAKDTLKALTTTGYGNLVPAGQPGKMFAGLEMLMGQIFLVTLVAGLVSLWRPGLLARTRKSSS